MSNIKGSLLFLLKSFVFSVIFFCTVFGFYTISPMNSSKRQMPDKTESIDIQEYNRQIKESSNAMERQKDLLKRAEANMAGQEENTKRMSAILDLWEQQAKKGK